MSKAFGILILALVASSNCSYSSSNLWISTFSYTFEDFGKDWKVFEPVIYGGSGSYLIKYDDLPEDWDYYDGKYAKKYSNSLFIPKDAPLDRY